MAVKLHLCALHRCDLHCFFASEPIIVDLLLTDRQVALFAGVCSMCLQDNTKLSKFLVSEAACVLEALCSAYQVLNSCWPSSKLGLCDAFFWQRIWLSCAHFLYQSLHTAQAVLMTLLCLFLL